MLGNNCKIPTQPHSTPQSVSGITDHTLTTINLKIPELHVTVSGNHHDIDEFVCDSSTPQLVIGFPWLQTHNPVIN